MSTPFQNVVIVGGSSAGLLSAIALKRYFPHLHVLLLYSHHYAPIGVGESTTAWLPQFLHHCLQISQGEFYQAVWPIWKLGIRFEWGDPALSHFNYTFDRPFTQETPALHRTPGFYCMYDLKQASRFSILMDKLHAPFGLDDQGQFHQISDGFGYHLGLEEFSRFLLQKVQDLGVEIQERKVLTAHQDSQGNLTALQCEGDVEIAGDLFVDCSGFQSQLLGKTLAEDFIPYGHRLFCDRALAADWPRQSPIFPFTTATTMQAGWRWRIDLRDRVSFGYVYSSSFCDENQALQEFLSLTPHATQNLRQIQFRSGRYRRFWVNNVVAIGNASGFVEPLESTGQHMIAETLWRVILGLQDSHLCPTPHLIATMNQYIGNLWDEICDFLTLHFKFNRKLNSPFWHHCREQTDIGAMQDLVDLYQETGVCRALAHLIPPASIFEVDGYLALLCGQRLPIQNQRSITAQEQQEWFHYRQHLQKILENSLPPQKALQILEKQLEKRREN